MLRAVQSLVQATLGHLPPRAMATRRDVAALLAGPAGAGLPPGLVAVLGTLCGPAADVEEARRGLLQAVAELRRLDCDRDAGLTALADVLFLYANTINWFMPQPGYKVTGAVG